MVNIAGAGTSRTEVSIVGDIDAFTTEVLTLGIGAQPERQVETLVVDLSRVSFCSIDGAVQLTELLLRAEAACVPWELLGRPRGVRRAMELVAGLETPPMREVRSPAEPIPVTGSPTRSSCR
ncbi:STAS domain-containing protein [Amycolatopsis antarctica]|uniref:STAS domain-containing protein n=1 Tax=Amycolatopsis antarctica TaxID=1854586 RepID=UPI0013FDCA40|nr:STAS domain-containing protein [Amycolatopsis antarctica]